MKVGRGGRRGSGRTQGHFCVASSPLSCASPLRGPVSILGSWRGLCSGCGCSGLWCSSSSPLPLCSHLAHLAHKLLEFALAVPEPKGPLDLRTRWASAQWRWVPNLPTMGCWSLEEGGGGFSSSLIDRGWAVAAMTTGPRATSCPVPSVGGWRPGWAPKGAKQNRTAPQE